MGAKAAVGGSKRSGRQHTKKLIRWDRSSIRSSNGENGVMEHLLDAGVASCLWPRLVFVPESSRLGMAGDLHGERGVHVKCLNSH